MSENYTKCECGRYTRRIYDKKLSVSYETEGFKLWFFPSKAHKDGTCQNCIDKMKWEDRRK